MPNENTGPLRLFLCLIDDANGENQDRFVTARSPEEAAAGWLDRMAEDGGWTREEIIGDYEDETLRVMQVPEVSTEPTAHEWPDQVSFDMAALAALVGAAGEDDADTEE